jgi:hypothetical protein
MAKAEAAPYPHVIATIPDDGMYLVALDPTWGRILNTHQRRYYPTQQIGTILVMSGPWEDYTGPQDVLGELVAQAHDVEEDLTLEQHDVLARRRRQRVAQFCEEVARAVVTAPTTPTAQGSRATRPEAIQDQQAMAERIVARIQEVTREARSRSDVPQWLWELGAQLGIEL